MLDIRTRQYCPEVAYFTANSIAPLLLGQDILEVNTATLGKNEVSSIVVLNHVACVAVYVMWRHTRVRLRSGGYTFGGSAWFFYVPGPAGYWVRIQGNQLRRNIPRDVIALLSQAWRAVCPSAQRVPRAIC